VTDIHTLSGLAAHDRGLRRLDEFAADLERLAARHGLDR
jgi:hypothetical protein